MFTNDFHFVWETPYPNEFEIRDVQIDFEKKPERALVRHPGVSFTRYSPMKGTVPLYRVFAEMTDTEESILKFANHYGFLQKVRPTVAIDGAADRLEVEPIAIWRREVKIMAEAVAIWEMIQNGDTRKLKKYVGWQGKTAVHFLLPSYKAFFDQVDQLLGTTHVHGDYPLLASQDRDPQLFASLKPGDVVRPAHMGLLQIVNAQLTHNVNPWLIWDYRRTRVVCQDIPNSLLGAIYFQFALAILHDRPSRQCEWCGKWIAPVGQRSDRKTCSNTCRTLAYRARQQRARELRRQGKSFRTIASELQTQIDTVKTWISKEQTP